MRENVLTDASYNRTDETLYTFKQKINTKDALQNQMKDMSVLKGTFLCRQKENEPQLRVKRKTKMYCCEIPAGNGSRKREEGGVSGAGKPGWRLAWRF